MTGYELIQRRMVYSLRCRIESSCNCIIKSIVNSCYYKKSTMYNMWNTILYLPTNYVELKLMCIYFSMDYMSDSKLKNNTLMCIEIAEPNTIGNAAYYKTLNRLKSKQRHVFSKTRQQSFASFVI